MEDASLDARVRPYAPPRPLDAAPAVADEHVGGRDARHEARPVLGVLGLRQVASDDVVVGAGDEDDALPGEPDAVHVDDVVDLVAYGQDRPDSPEPARMLAERPRVGRQLRLGELSQQPRHEGPEPSRRRVVPDDLGAAAGLAPPSLRARFGKPVLLHGCAADAAFPDRHRLPPPEADFFLEKASLSRRVKPGSDTLFCL